MPVLATDVASQAIGVSIAAQVSASGVPYGPASRGHELDAVAVRYNAATT